MDIERVVHGGDIDRARFGDTAGRRVRKMIRRADEKSREGMSTIQRRADEGVAFSSLEGFAGGAPGRAMSGFRRGLALQSRHRNKAAVRLARRRRVEFRSGLAGFGFASLLAQFDRQALDRAEFGNDVLFDAIEIM